MPSLYRSIGQNKSGFGKKIAAVVVVLAMVFSTTPALLAEDGSAGPSPLVTGAFKVGESDLDIATFGNGQRKLVRTDNGTLHAVWQDNLQVYYAFSMNNGRDWSAAVNVSNNTGDNYYPSIATNGNHIYIAWQELRPGTDYLRFRGLYSDTGVWEPDRSQPGNTASSGGGRRYYYPALAAEGTYVFIAVASPNNGDNEMVCYRHTDHGRGWGWTGQWVAWDASGWEQQHPSIAVHGGSVYIAYESDQGGDWEIWIARSGDSGSTWGGHTQLTTNGLADRHPSLTLNGSRLFLTWERYDSGRWDINYMYSTNFFSGWIPAIGQPPLNVSDSQSDSRYPSIVHEDDATYILWEEQMTSASDVYLSINSTGTWGNPMDLTRGMETLRLPNAYLNITNQRLDYLYTRVNGSGPHDVLYDWYPLANTAPVLAWTGETNYESDGLDPEGTTTGHVYTYRVEYTDADDDGPRSGFPEVMVDRNLDGVFDSYELNSMDEVDPLDTDHTDGKLYTFTTTFSNLGTYFYRFRARDDNGTWATGSPTTKQTGPVITTFNVAPILDWTEEIGYVQDGLEPEAGDVGMNFTYKIRYIDKFDEAPANGYPMVLFDMDKDGDFDDAEDEQVTMLEASSQDTSFDNGKNYYYVRTFDTNGTFHYKFVAYDLIGLVAETETMAGPNVTIPTEIPILSWVDEDGYRTDGVDPDRGSKYTSFVFKVNYSDADGEEPRMGAVEVGIDLDMNSTFEASEWVLMDALDPADDNYTDNKTYTYERSFDLGTYNYTFRAWDTVGALALGDATGIRQVLVDIDNEPPLLKWTNEENYTSEGLNPEVGTTNLTEFVYRIRYEDTNNDLPAVGWPTVGIDEDLDGTIEADEHFVMVEVSDLDTDVTDGKLYTYTHVFTAMGNYTYTFKAKDVYAFATGTPTGIFSGPDINAEFIFSEPPVLEWVNKTGYVDDGVEPDSGLSSDTFVFKIGYFDADNDTPLQGNPKLLVDMDQDGQFTSTEDWSLVMNEEDIDDMDVTDGKIFVRSVSFDKKGLFNYTFEAASIRTETKFEPGILTGVVNVTGVNVAPVLSWLGRGLYVNDGVSPDAGIPGENFEYRVNYSDTDNDPPATGYPKLLVDLDGDYSFDPILESFEMLTVDPTDLTYSDGKEFYYFGISFTSEGTFSYSFEVEDGRGTPGNALVGTGPVVKIPVKNDPPELRFMDTDVQNKYDGVEPVYGDVEDTFYFTVVYWDVEGDMPKADNPRVIIDPDDAGMPTTTSKVISMEEMDENDDDVTDGKVYMVSVELEAGDHEYAFDVINEMNQTDILGPLDGPIVIEKETGPNGTTKTDEGLGDLLWIIILIIAAIVCILIGYLAGRSKRPKTTPEEIQDSEPSHREGVSLSEATEEDIDEPPPEDEVPEEEVLPEEDEPPPEDEAEESGEEEKKEEGESDE